jgi:pyridoxine kinase
MARVLAISSHVAFGSVGLAVIVPALQALRHEVVALPTIILSNHPGYASFSGEQVASAALTQIVDALDANGWLETIDAVLTGYLPTVAHVTAAAEAIARVLAANPSALVVCDPVCGDEPKGLYLDAAVPAAIADEVLPQCDVATPNRFELSWLTDAPVESPAAAVVAARALGVPAVLATSIPADDDRLATLLISESEARACVVPRRAAAPHGTGDLLAALYLGHLLNGDAPAASLGRAVAAVEAAIAASAGRDELPLIAADAAWAQAKALPTASI